MEFVKYFNCYTDIRNDMTGKGIASSTLTTIFSLSLIS